MSLDSIRRLREAASGTQQLVRMRAWVVLRGWWHFEPRCFSSRRLRAWWTSMGSLAFKIPATNHFRCRWGLSKTCFSLASGR